MKLLGSAAVSAAMMIAAPVTAKDAAFEGVPGGSAFAPAPAGYLTLPANTELTVTPNSEVSSKSMKKGDVFTISTVYDVMMNGLIVIPKGTRGQGKITWRTGKGAFGKSAKMDLVFEWLELGGRRVVLEGKHRQEGQGNTAATIGTVLAVGVFGGFVTGKSAIVPNGIQLKAFTAEPIQFQSEALRPVPQQAVVVGSGISQGTSPAVTPVSSGDHAQ